MLLNKLLGTAKHLLMLCSERACMAPTGSAFARRLGRLGVLMAVVLAGIGLTMAPLGLAQDQPSIGVVVVKLQGKEIPKARCVVTKVEGRASSYCVYQTGADEFKRDNDDGFFASQLNSVGVIKMDNDVGNKNLRDWLDKKGNLDQRAHKLAKVLLLQDPDRVSKGDYGVIFGSPIGLQEGELKKYSNLGIDIIDDGKAQDIMLSSNMNSELRALQIIDKDQALGLISNLMAMEIAIQKSQDKKEIEQLKRQLNDERDKLRQKDDELTQIGKDIEGLTKQKQELDEEVQSSHRLINGLLGSELEIKNLKENMKLEEKTQALVEHIQSSKMMGTQRIMYTILVVVTLTLAVVLGNLIYSRHSNMLAQWLHKNAANKNHILTELKNTQQSTIETIKKMMIEQIPDKFKRGFNELKGQITASKDELIGKFEQPRLRAIKLTSELEGKFENLGGQISNLSTQISDLSTRADLKKKPPVKLKLLKLIGQAEEHPSSWNADISPEEYYLVEGEGIIKGINSYITTQQEMANLQESKPNLRELLNIAASGSELWQGELNKQLEYLVDGEEVIRYINVWQENCEFREAIESLVADGGSALSSNHDLIAQLKGGIEQIANAVTPKSSTMSLLGLAEGVERLKGENESKQRSIEKLGEQAREKEQSYNKLQKSKDRTTEELEKITASHQILENLSEALCNYVSLPPGLLIGGPSLALDKGHQRIYDQGVLQRIQGLTQDESYRILRLTLVSVMAAWDIAIDSLKKHRRDDVVDGLGLEKFPRIWRKLLDSPPELAADALWNAIFKGFQDNWLHDLFRADYVFDAYLPKGEQGDEGGDIFDPMRNLLNQAASAFRTAMDRCGYHLQAAKIGDAQPIWAEPSPNPTATNLLGISEVKNRMQTMVDKGDRNVVVNIERFGYIELNKEQGTGVRINRLNPSDIS